VLGPPEESNLPRGIFPAEPHIAVRLSIAVALRVIEPGLHEAILFGDDQIFQRVRPSCEILNSIETDLRN
jgi:hypothetical protein